MAIKIRTIKVSDQSQLYKHLALTGMVLIFPLFFFGGPSHNSLRSVTAFWNIGHVFFFFLFVCFIFHQKRDGFNWLWALKISIWIVALGAAIEFIQSGIDGRTVSVLDIVRDLMGGILGIAFVGRPKFTPWQHKGIFITSIVIISWNLYPTANSAIDEWQARQSFPLLAGFENKRELSRWTGNATWQQSHKQARQGRYSLKVDLTTDKYSGLALKYFPRDWRHYSTLQLNIFNCDTSNLPVTIRIHDLQHEQGKQRYDDRFNRTFTLQHGWNDIKINLKNVQNAPKNRPMQMNNIRSIGIFVIEQKTNRIIYIDNVRLA